MLGGASLVDNHRPDLEVGEDAGHSRARRCGRHRIQAQGVVFDACERRERPTYRSGFAVAPRARLPAMTVMQAGAEYATPVRRIGLSCPTVLHLDCTDDQHFPLWLRPPPPSQDRSYCYRPFRARRSQPTGQRSGVRDHAVASFPQ